MKALRFHAAKDLRIEDIEALPAPGPGQVAIRNRFVGICGTDLHEYSYGPIFIPKVPHPFTGAHGPQVLGHEFGGVVTAVGDGVAHVAPGDRVSVQPLIMPRSGDYFADRGLFHLSPDLALAGLSWLSGGMAEAALLNDYNVVRIPDALSDEEAALVEPTAVAVYACDRGGVAAGNSVLVTGAGPIGILTLLAARAFGATTLFVSDLNDTRLEIARQILPGVVILNPERDDIGARIRAATEGGVGCDVALECVGNEKALASCLDAVRKQGVIVQVGLHPGNSGLDWFNVTFKDVDLRGSWAYPTHLWPRVVDLIASGAIPASKVVTARIRLDEAVTKGFDALLDPAGTHLKILIDLT
ncbi:(R,R)-butanediol dehydrogenase / meso-butanediol dehydrogenase / diacetyl reductase [Paracoccus alcaliphilus]|uniref:(R,R)-butanediol dehydrogenase / meso-butanediol dehydrogenase / diacetyl reductase n=1 Tax=Paracoccus alcaliphilus TaxID=34002 RepID=A0A1H8ED76_9RHOB|nr:2,3-butanediol dehydrogenase [Paracoccus alcaliphilus]WCR20986.1 2,3-butanediol dehydrogenase [Paracoccus alcaliphilus]SEN17472.1 (R,R)-butanediol dehydrogenase / meso-butanediol dehydrogenase / diacetyl reductase [Paracoccus alcaliphilus]